MATQPHILDKSESLTLTGIFRVGISWDTSTRGMGGVFGRFSQKLGTDLDLIGIAHRADNEPVKMAGLDNLDPFKNGAMLHSGDNRSGHGEGDDETIVVNLDTVPAYVHSIVFIAVAFKRHSSFKDADNIEFKVYDDAVTADPFAQFIPSLRNMGVSNACIIVRAERVNGQWLMRPIDKAAHVKQGDKDHLLSVAMRAT